MISSSDILDTFFSINQLPLMGKLRYAELLDELSCPTLTFAAAAWHCGRKSVTTASDVFCQTPRRSGYRYKFVSRLYPSRLCSLSESYVTCSPQFEKRRVHSPSLR